MYGTPPQGCADYAFQQHILKSLNPKNGRSIVLWPNGVLFRDSEKVFREKMLEDDVVEAVIGLGPNLFYNSPMEACLLVTNLNKPKEHKGKVLFINAVKEVVRENANSHLEEKHIQKIYEAYKGFKDIDRFARVLTNKDILDNNANLNIALYVSSGTSEKSEKSLEKTVSEWTEGSLSLKKSTKELFEILER